MRSMNLRYQPRVDQLRWLAATLVFLYHFQLEYRGLGGAALATPWAGIVTEGHTGVGLFFTLSGFLFMRIAQHNDGVLRYGDYLRNRLLRIAPLFLTIFLVATSIGRDDFQPQDLLYLLATNLGHAPTSATVVTGAAWTISLECLFYLLFPFLARFTLERGARYLLQWLALMAFFKLAAYGVNRNSTLMYFCTFIGRFDQFLAGMLAAMLYRRHRAGLHRHAPWLLAPAAALVIAGSAALHRFAPFGGSPAAPLWIFWSLFESFGWAWFILAWAAFEPRLPRPLERMLCHGGKVSFSFYLLHMGMLHLLAEHVGLVRPSGIGWIDAAVMVALAYGASWALATLSYHTIEEPFLRLRRRYGPARAAAPPTLDEVRPRMQAGIRKWH
ncbi:acyltransferase [Massilia forsythiae]|uniref:Acyltransferase n=1 Tax=Massilia forsythiae TaxID=2728020 RepID=A0A7Z2ZSW1_9BURK|nr:acyltransferase [Massilia forsythiae]QJE00714.1 acyltransferase [Massilia forsythiae]